jgi:trk system potassium uptake protein TrkH
MNYSVVIYILGWIMEIEAAFLALPGIVSAIYGEKGGFAFLWVALGSAVAGSAIILRKPKNMRFYLREGFVTVALSWILMSVIGCLPFVINGDIPHFADALFEMISGFTTRAAYSGEASAIGSEAWAFLYFCLPSCRWREAAT